MVMQGKLQTLSREWRVTAGNGPTKTVDDTNHRIERVEQAPFFGNNRAAETDRRNVKPELDDEGNNIAKIAVFYVQGRQPDTGAGGSEQRENRE